MFFVIDGIDASGKTTQVELLAEKLASLGKTVKIVDFPRYSEESSYFVRQYLAGNYGDFVDAKTSSLFFAMDRFEASFQLKKDLLNYDYIIANRYVSSSMIHHGCKIEDTDKRNLFFDWLEHLEYDICSIPRPDLVFFLSLSFENNLKLLQERHIQTGNTGFDLHERNHAYLKTAWQAAHEIAAEKHWNVIECEQEGMLLEREEITQKILEQIV